MLLFFLSIFLCSCTRSYNTSVSVGYVSKINHEFKTYSINNIEAIAVKNNTYKINDKDFEKYDTQMKGLNDYFAQSHVYDFRNDQKLFDNNICYIFSNNDSYFSLGKNKDNYYSIIELKGMICTYDIINDSVKIFEFAVPPLLHNIDYIVQGEELISSNDISIETEYTWEYLKEFYSRLSYTEIIEDEKRIIVNAYTIMANIEMDEGSETIQTLCINYKIIENRKYLMVRYKEN
jgi:hypothetical protein